MPALVYNEEGEYFLFKMLLLGDSGVGKKSFVNRYFEGTMTPSYQTESMNTLGVDFKINTIEIKGHTIKIQVWNTAGQERFRTITSSYYKGAHAILVFYDCTDQASFNNCKSWFNELNRYADETTARLAVATKCDLLSKKVVELETAQREMDKHGVQVIETSSLTGLNVERALECLVEREAEKIEPPKNLKSARAVAHKVEEEQEFKLTKPVKSARSNAVNVSPSIEPRKEKLSFLKKKEKKEEIPIKSARAVAASQEEAPVEIPSDPILKISILGDEQVGKSCLLQRFVDNTYSDSTRSTSATLKEKTMQRKDKQVHLRIWDVPPIALRFNNYATYFRGTMGAFIVFDLTCQLSFDNVKQWMSFQGKHFNSDYVMVLIGNKSDLKDKRVVTYDTAKELADSTGCLYLETSAFEPQNVQKMFEDMIDEIFASTQYNLRSKRETVVLAPISPTNTKNTGCC